MCALGSVELLDCVDVSVIIDIHNYSLVPRPPCLALLDAFLIDNSRRQEKKRT